MITLAGASASAATTTTFIRVNRASVTTTGTYTGSNVGDIVIETSDGASVLCSIVAGLGQTQVAVYTVPAGYTALITGIDGGVDSGKYATVNLNTRSAAQTTSAPFAARRVRYTLAGVTGPFTVDFHSYLSVPEKSDIWLSALGPSGGASVSGTFSLYLVEN